MDYSVHYYYATQHKLMIWVRILYMTSPLLLSSEHSITRFLREFMIHVRGLIARCNFPLLRYLNGIMLFRDIGQLYSLIAIFTTFSPLKERKCSRWHRNLISVQTGIYKLIAFMSTTSSGYGVYKTLCVGFSSDITSH